MRMKILTHGFRKNDPYAYVWIYKELGLKEKPIHREPVASLVIYRDLNNMQIYVYPGMKYIIETKERPKILDNDNVCAEEGNQ